MPATDATRLVEKETSCIRGACHRARRLRTAAYPEIGSALWPTLLHLIHEIDIDFHEVLYKVSKVLNLTTDPAAENTFFVISNYQHACWPKGATFSERSLAKNLVSKLICPDAVNWCLLKHVTDRVLQDLNIYGFFNKPRDSMKL